jgi:hypothetical protein
MEGERLALENLGNLYTTCLYNDLLAENCYNRAMKLLETMRTNVIEVEHRTGLLVRGLDTYTGLVTLSLRNGRLAAALGYIEQARSRGFLDLLRVVLLQPARYVSGEITELLARESELLSRLRALQLGQPSSGVPPHGLGQLLTDLELLYMRLQEQVPEYVVLRKGVPVDLKEVKLCLQNV